MNTTSNIYNFEMYGKTANYLGVQPVREEDVLNFLNQDWYFITYRLLCITDENLTDEEVWESS